MLHTSIEAVYLKQKEVYRRCINMAFASAGTFWIVIYTLRVFELITEESITALRHGQTLPYFVLLSVWGTEFMREASRLKQVITIANGNGCTPNEVTADLLGKELRRFSVISPLAGSRLMPAINIIGLIAGYLLIFNQYRLMVTMVM